MGADSILPFHLQLTFCTVFQCLINRMLGCMHERAFAHKVG